LPSPLVRRRLLLVGILVAVGLAVTAWPRVVLIEVRDAAGVVVFARQACYGDPVEYSYLHSVERSTVIERFEVVPNGLKLVMTSFGSAGAGLPASHPDLVTREGRFVIEGLNTTMHELPLLGGEATESRLEFRGETYALRGRLTVSVRRYPVWTAGWRRATAAGL
jgi:hypothetical protein